MTLQEAIKSRRRFRRPNCPYWSQSPITGGFPYSKITLEFDDILADDWEVEQVPIAVTEAEFDAAWDKASSINSAGQWLASFKDTLKKELGL